MHPDDERGPLKNVLKLLVALGLRSLAAALLMDPAAGGRIAPGMIDMIKSLPWGDKRKATLRILHLINQSMSKVHF
eukprot:Skav228477  [mRNA]  locus=scaffold1092:412:3262:- [translate_table: standard]